MRANHALTATRLPAPPPSFFLSSKKASDGPCQHPVDLPLASSLARVSSCTVRSLLQPCAVTIAVAVCPSRLAPFVPSCAVHPNLLSAVGTWLASLQEQTVGLHPPWLLSLAPEQEKNTIRKSKHEWPLQHQAQIQAAPCPPRRPFPRQLPCPGAVVGDDDAARPLLLLFRAPVSILVHATLLVRAARR